MEYAISPPNTRFVTQAGLLSPEGYRYLVQAKKQGDGLVEAPVLTASKDQAAFPNSRALAVTARLTRTDADPNLTIDLAVSGVTAGPYGSATRLAGVTVDDYGRITIAADYELNSDNVTEGTANLFFTDARARAALSGSGQIAYDSSTGVIDTTGFSGSGAYTSFTFVNGVCTAAS